MTSGSILSVGRESENRRRSVKTYAKRGGSWEKNTAITWATFAVTFIPTQRSSSEHAHCIASEGTRRTSRKKRSGRAAPQTPRRDSVSPLRQNCVTNAAHDYARRGAKVRDEPLTGRGEVWAVAGEGKGISSYGRSMREMVGGCCVCSDERGWAENPLVYCDGHGCSVAVHQGNVSRR